jgi:carboxymethylenebutenolidase
MGETVEFSSNGQTATGWMQLPKSARGPGVVVIQEWWGLDPHIKDVVERFAGEGFVALAPDLYHGEETAEPDEGEKLMMAMDLDRVAKDMKGAVEYLAAHPAVTSPGVGAVGFCMGGGLVLWLACLSDKVAAAVPFYGAPWPDDSPNFENSVAAFQGHYAEHDDWATPEIARRLESQLRGLGHTAEFFVYRGTQHAFFNDDRPESHDPGAAKIAWERTVEFLRSRLAG